MRAPSPHTGNLLRQGELVVVSARYILEAGIALGRAAAGPYLFNKARPAALVGPFLTK